MKISEVFQLKYRMVPPHKLGEEYQSERHVIGQNLYFLSTDSAHAMIQELIKKLHKKRKNEEFKVTYDMPLAVRIVFSDGTLYEYKVEPVTINIR